MHADNLVNFCNLTLETLASWRASSFMDYCSDGQIQTAIRFASPLNRLRRFDLITRLFGLSTLKVRFRFYLKFKEIRFENRQIASRQTI